MRRLSLIVAAVALVALPAAAKPPPRLTAEGWGNLRIGMREAEAVRRFHLVVPGDDGVSSVECRELTFPKGDPALSVMTQNRRVVRLSLYGPSPLRTDKNLGVGSKERDVRRASGRALKVTPHKYEEPPAHYLTVWSAKTKRGVRYETDKRGLVTAVHVGGEAINLVESCL